MEAIEESLTKLLEEEGNFLRACKEYLHNEAGQETSNGEHIQELLFLHRVRFDEVDMQLTSLENMA